MIQRPSKRRSCYVAVPSSATVPARSINNLNSYLKHDRGVEKDLVARLKKAERDRDAAKAARAEAR